MLLSVDAYVVVLDFFVVVVVFCRFCYFFKSFLFAVTQLLVESSPCSVFKNTQLKCVTRGAVGDCKGTLSFKITYIHNGQTQNCIFLN